MPWNNEVLIYFQKTKRLYSCNAQNFDTMEQVRLLLSRALKFDCLLKVYNADINMIRYNGCALFLFTDALKARAIAGGSAAKKPRVKIPN